MNLDNNLMVVYSSLNMLTFFNPNFDYPVRFLDRFAKKSKNENQQFDLLS